MKLRSITRQAGLTGTIARLGVVIAVASLIFGPIILVGQQNRAKIHYSLKTADCSAETIAIRNKSNGYNSKSCVLIVTAHNLQNKSVTLDYDGVGGGPLAGLHPKIKIYSTDQKFCYALLGGRGSSFAPNATNELTLKCGGIQNPPKNYDQASDTNPTSIKISSYPETNIKVEPTR